MKRKTRKTCEHIEAGEELSLRNQCAPCNDMQAHLHALAAHLSDNLRPEGQGLLWPKAEIFYEYPGSIQVAPTEEALGPALVAHLSRITHWQIAATPGWDGTLSIPLNVEVGGFSIWAPDLKVCWTGDLDKDAKIWADAIRSVWPRIIRLLRGPSIRDVSPKNPKGSTGRAPSIRLFDLDRYLDL